MNWILIKDIHPDDSLEDILVSCQQVVYMARFNGGAWLLYYSDAGLSECSKDDKAALTHWMPLPELPK